MFLDVEYSELLESIFNPLICTMIYRDPCTPQTYVIFISAKTDWKIKHHTEININLINSHAVPPSRSHIWF